MDEPLPRATEEICSAMGVRQNAGRPFFNRGAASVNRRLERESVIDS